MPTIEPFTPIEIGPKSWGEELLVAHTDTYIAKRLSMRAGSTGPLQHHAQKDETFFLHSGHVKVEYVQEDGARVIVDMFPGQSFHVPPGAIHRVEAVLDSVLFEASTPVFDDRVAYVPPPLN